MSTINQVPDSVFYNPDSWIDLAPGYDWSKLVPPPAPEPDPEPAPESDPEPEPDPEEPPAEEEPPA